MKKTFVFCLLAGLFVLSGCKNEPEEISAEESIDSAAITDTGFTTSAEGVQQIYAAFRVKKTDNLSGKTLNIKAVRSGNSEYAKIYTSKAASGRILVDCSETSACVNLGETTEFTFYYDDTYSKSVSVKFAVPSVKNAGWTSDSTSITANWDNSLFKDYTGFISGVHISATAEKDSNEETVLADTDAGFETSCKITGLDSSLPYTIEIYVLSATGEKSDVVSLGPVYPGKSPDKTGETLIWELENTKDAETVAVNNGKNKTFYIVETNSGSYDSAETCFYADGIETTGTVSRAVFDEEYVNKIEPVFEDDDGITEIPYEQEEMNPEDFILEDDDEEGLDGIFESSTTSTYSPGDEKSIYVINEIKNGIEVTNSVKATLRVQTEHCNAWIVNGYEGTGSSLKITADKAREFCNTFEELYELERNIFGEESDNLIYSSSSFKKMSSDSDTGTKVNLVFFDIDGDGETSSLTLGYFKSGDYYYTESKSNKGKYLYIDTYAVNAMYLKTVSTIAHEYQHMINFSAKSIRPIEKAFAAGSKVYSIRNTGPWFTEMSSLLAEDMLQSKLALDDSDSPKHRIDYFNSGFMKAGITHWNKFDSTELLQDYARAYAFGAYLTRKYGGAEFVKDYMANDYLDMECVLAAVRMRDPGATEDTLLRDFACACVNNNKDCTELPSFKRDAAKTVSLNGYDYPMTGFSPWNYSNGSSSGPVYYDGLRGHKSAVPEHGIKISKIGHSKSDNVKINVHGGIGQTDGLKVYIVAVPD